MAADIGTLITAGIAVAGGLGGSIGYFAKTRGDSIIKYQAIEIDERDKTNARLKETIAALTAERDAVTKENEHYKARNKELINLSQGSPQLKKLTEAITTLTRIVTQNMKGKT